MVYNNQIHTFSQDRFYFLRRLSRRLESHIFHSTIGNIYVSQESSVYVEHVNPVTIVIYNKNVAD